MVIDVRLVPEGHSEIVSESRLSGFAGDLPPFAEPVKCMAGIDRMEGTIVVGLRFSGAFEAECARCLEVYRQPVEGELRVIIREEQGRYGASLDDGDGADFFFDVNHELVDISSAIYDEIMIALPLKPLCSEGCEGIKIEGAAGGDAGGGDEGPVDPRWAGLMKLKSGR
ncbi:MAG: DUF177 domain-containing protein [Chitinispirillia bacterium]|nr:DUF177 domain-containing protein [Chitinispirillia bacterium]MCL2269049.1 DUF177 domain-containing protein [Chitinispirillia bacterium]